MVRYPKLIKPSVSDMHVSLVDIKPTILNFTETPYKEKVSGVDLMPFMTREKDQSLGRKYSFSQRVTPDKNGKRNIWNYMVCCQFNSLNNMRIIENTEL